MNSSTQKELIIQLQNQHRSAKVTIGTTIGIILIIYFFTFAMLVDKFPPIFFIFEGVTAIIFALALFQLNRIAFAWVKFKAGKNPDKLALLAKLDHNSLDQSPEAIAQRLQQN